MDTTSQAPPQNTSHQTLRQLNDRMAVQLVPAMLYVGVLMLVGLAGNILVCYVYSFRLRMGTQNFLIVCLAVFDLLSCSIAMPTEIVDMRFFHMFPNDFTCRLLRFVISYCAFASILTLVVIAVDRFRKICRPWNRQMSLRDVKIAVVAVLLVSLVFAIPAALLNGIRHTKIGETDVIGYDCSTSDAVQNTAFPLVYNSVLFFVFLVLLVTVAVLYTKIWIEMKRHNKYMARNFDASGINVKGFSPKEELSSDANSPSFGETPREQNPSSSSAENPKEENHGRSSAEARDGENYGPSSAEARDGENYGPSSDETPKEENQLLQLCVRKNNHTTQIRKNSASKLCGSEENSVQLCNKITTTQTSFDKENNRTSQHRDKEDNHTSRDRNCVHDVSNGQTDLRDRSDRSIRHASHLSQTDQSDVGVCELGDKSSSATSENVTTASATERAGANVDRPSLQSTDSGGGDTDSSHYLHEMCIQGDESAENGAQTVITRQTDSNARKTESLSGVRVSLASCVGILTGARQDCGSSGDEEEKTTRKSELKQVVSWSSSTGRLSDNDVKETTEDDDNMHDVIQTDAEICSIHFSSARHSLSGGTRYRADDARVDDEVPRANSDVTHSAGDVSRSCEPVTRSRHRMKHNLAVSAVKSTKATIIAFSVTVVFLVSFVPHLSLVVSRIVVQDYDYSLQDAALVFYHIFLRSYFVSSASNPIIYGVLNKRFRAECLRALRQLLTCTRLRKSTEVSDR